MNTIVEKWIVNFIAVKYNFLVTEAENVRREIKWISTILVSRRISLSDESDTDSDVLFETRSKTNGSANGKVGRRKC